MGADAEDVVDDVFGEGVVAAVVEGGGAGGLGEGECAAGRETDEEGGVFAGRGGDADEVVEERGGDADGVDGGLEADDVVAVEDGLEGGEFGGGGASFEDAGFVFGGGVAEGDAGEEAVELVLGEGVGAFELVGVLGGDDHEGGVELEDAAVDADGGLVHGFEEGGLGARGRAVDFVGEDDVGEDWPAAEDEVVGCAVEDAGAQDVAGEHVWGELDAAEGAVDAAGEGGGEDGFADAGDVFDEEVAAGEEAADGAVDGVGVAVVDAGDVVAEGLE